MVHIGCNDYGPFEFNGGSLDRTNYPQGYMDCYGWMYVYVPDYQGNILGIYNGATGRLDQFTDYYPYGQPHPDSTSPELNRRKFGAKELTTSFGLNEYDFAARRLSPLGSFTQPDPLAGKYPSISPYSYCAADPINLIDPTGTHWVINNETGIITWMDNVKSKNDTPDGYDYVGSTNESILDYFQLRRTYTSSESHVYIYCDSPEEWSPCKGAFIGAADNLCANITISPIIDIGDPIDNNQTGLLFKGLAVRSSFLQNASTGTAPLSLFLGRLETTIANKNYYFRFSLNDYTKSSIYSSGYILQTCGFNIYFNSVNAINDFNQISLKFGCPRNAILNLPVIINFNLR